MFEEKKRMRKNLFFLVIYLKVYFVNWHMSEKILNKVFTGIMFWIYKNRFYNQEKDEKKLLN